MGTIGDGQDVLAKKAQWASRRGALRAHKRELGAGAKGHGEKRRYETYRALDDVERNWVKTYVQQRAAAVVAVAGKFGCGSVVLEDYGAKAMADDVDGQNAEVARLIRQFPFAQLKTAIEWACAKAGIRVVIVPAQYESVTCPKCGNIDASQDGGRGVFRCAKCSLERSVDGVAAWNMLRSAGSPDGFTNADKAMRSSLQGPAKKVATPKKRPPRKPQRDRGSVWDWREG
jgi:IS605 OrfB family transposase